MRVPRMAAMIGALLVLGAAPALGQSISGTLVDETTGHPVTDAAVLLVDADSVVRAETRTDDSGAWSARVPEPSERYSIRAQKVGYATVETAPFLVNNAPALTRLTTRPEIVTLEAVSAQRLTYQGILSRRERRMGYIIDANDIAARIARLRPANTAELVERLLPGMRIDPHTHGLFIPRRLGRRGCNPIIVIDGQRYKRPPRWPPWDINALVDLWEIRAIEIYQDPQFVPKELGLKHTAFETCGTIVVWTDRGVGWAP